MIHNPTLASGTHDVSYHLPSNPSSPFTSKQCSCTRWCHPASSSLPYPLPSQLSCLPSSLPSPLSTCLVLGVCYVIKPVDLFPSSVQHYSTIINANLHQSTILVVASYKARKRLLHEYLQVQIHSIMQWYHWYYMLLKIDKMLSQNQGVLKSNNYNHKFCNIIS